MSMTSSYDGAGFIRSELEYRAQRATGGARGQRRRHVRVPLVRRPADGTR